MSSASPPQPPALGRPLEPAFRPRMSSAVSAAGSGSSFKQPQQQQQQYFVEDGTPDSSRAILLSAIQARRLNTGVRISEDAPISNVQSRHPSLLSLIAADTGDANSTQRSMLQTTPFTSQHQTLRREEEAPSMRNLMQGGRTLTRAQVELLKARRVAEFQAMQEQRVRDHHHHHFNGGVHHANAAASSSSPPLQPGKGIGFGVVTAATNGRSYPVLPAPSQLMALLPAINGASTSSSRAFSRSKRQGTSHTDESSGNNDNDNNYNSRKQNGVEKGGSNATSMYTSSISDSASASASASMSATDDSVGHYKQQQQQQQRLLPHQKQSSAAHETVASQLYERRLQSTLSSGQTKMTTSTAPAAAMVVGNAGKGLTKLKMRAAVAAAAAKASAESPSVTLSNDVTTQAQKKKNDDNDGDDNDDDDGQVAASDENILPKQSKTSQDQDQSTIRKSSTFLATIRKNSTSAIEQTTIADALHDTGSGGSNNPNTKSQDIHTETTSEEDAATQILLQQQRRPSYQPKPLNEPSLSTAPLPQHQQEQQQQQIFQLPSTASVAALFAKAGSKSHATAIEAVKSVAVIQNPIAPASHPPLPISTQQPLLYTRSASQPTPPSQIDNSEISSSVVFAIRPIPASSVSYPVMLPSFTSTINSSTLSLSFRNPSQHPASGIHLSQPPSSVTMPRYDLTSVPASNVVLADAAMRHAALPRSSTSKAALSMMRNEDSLHNSSSYLHHHQQQQQQLQPALNQLRAGFEAARSAKRRSQHQQFPTAAYSYLSAAAATNPVGQPPSLTSGGKRRNLESSGIESVGGDDSLLMMMSTTSDADFTQRDDSEIGERKYRNENAISRSFAIDAPLVSPTRVAPHPPSSSRPAPRQVPSSKAVVPPRRAAPPTPVSAEGQLKMQQQQQQAQASPFAAGFLESTFKAAFQKMGVQMPDSVKDTLATVTTGREMNDKKNNNNNRSSVNHETYIPLSLPDQPKEEKEEKSTNSGKPDNTTEAITQSLLKNPNTTSSSSSNNNSDSDGNSSNNNNHKNQHRSSTTAATSVIIATVMEEDEADNDEEEEEYAEAGQLGTEKSATIAFSGVSVVDQPQDDSNTVIDVKMEEERTKKEEEEERDSLQSPDIEELLISLRSLSSGLASILGNGEDEKKKRQTKNNSILDAILSKKKKSPKKEMLLQVHREDENSNDDEHTTTIPASSSSNKKSKNMTSDDSKMLTEICFPPESSNKRKSSKIFTNDQQVEKNTPGSIVDAAHAADATNVVVEDAETSFRAELAKAHPSLPPFLSLLGLPAPGSLFAAESVTLQEVGEEQEVGSDTDNAVLETTVNNAAAGFTYKKDLDDVQQADNRSDNEEEEEEEENLVIPDFLSFSLRDLSAAVRAVASAHSALFSVHVEPSTVEKTKVGDEEADPLIASTAVVPTAAAATTTSSLSESLLPPHHLHRNLPITALQYRPLSLVVTPFPSTASSTRRHHHHQQQQEAMVQETILHDTTTSREKVITHQQSQAEIENEVDDDDDDDDDDDGENTVEPSSSLGLKTRNITSAVSSLNDLFNTDGDGDENHDDVNRSRLRISSQVLLSSAVKRESHGRGDHVISDRYSLFGPLP